ncbi:voltage-dependent calcium channel subunit alpha-2/delta-2-like [Lineus longissimus]|uniref:voltage-dependent calcium channel subunit alpha-2/delta-2-like n=1 Tax=Lineus longissimus TaxID=88925 RepID=UPI002B4C7AA4
MTKVNNYFRTGSTAWILILMAFLLVMSGLGMSAFASVHADGHGGYSIKAMAVSDDEKPYCSFFANRAPTPQPLLKNCSMFKDNSCCLQQEIAATFGKVKPLKGSSRECQIHMNYLMCYICAPTQHMFYSRERLTVCEDFCDALYDACKSAILKGSLISHLYQNGRSFCLSRSFEVAPPTAVRCFRYYSEKDKNASKNIQYNIRLISMCLFIHVLSFLITKIPSGSPEMNTVTKGSKRSKVKHKLLSSVTETDSVKIVRGAMCFSNALPSMFTAIFLCSILLLPTSVHSVRPSDVNRWARLVSEDFSAFTEQGLQFDAIQRAYFDASYDTKVVDGKTKIKEVKQKLESFFSKKKTMAEQLARKVADLYDSWSVSTPVPISLQSLSGDDYKDADLVETLPGYMAYSSDFNLPVLLNASTVKIPDDVERNDPSVIKTVMLTSKLDQLFQENAKLDPDLRWQYFGSSNGVHRQFPGREWQSNFIGFREDFDPRLRPWYIAATSGPKDIVIILDGSTSMSANECLMKMKKVAKTLIGSLSPQDYLNVIVSRSTYYDNQGMKQEFAPESLACRSDRLLQATLNLRKSIMANIQLLKPNGGSDHRAAFTKAFKLLDGPSKSGCQSIIIFITDAAGKDKLQRCDPGYYRYDSESRRRYIPGDYCVYNIDDVINHVETLQKGRSEPVSIFSFVTKSDEQNIPFHQELTCQNRGMAVAIVDDDAIFKQMSPYFNNININSSAGDVVWTSPYIDKSGLGLMLSAAAPVYSNKTGKHLGVVGLDATLTSIERLLQYERRGMAYAFLIDEDATAVVHPFVKPSAELLEEAIFANIYSLETHNGKPAAFYNVVKEILQDRTGEYTIRDDAQRAVSFDNALYWRPEEYTHYVYTHIKGSDFYLVFSLGDGDDVVRYARPPNSYNLTYLSDLTGYLELKEEGKLIPLVTELRIVKDREKFTGLPVTMAASTVKLAPRCFCDPDDYVKLNRPSLFDIHEDINKPSSYSPPQCPNGTFQTGVRADVHLTAIPEDKWRRRDASIQNEIVWTYIGTASGVLRIFPGAELEKTYDTVSRPWYNSALINRGKVAISKVYLDASKIGKVVTFSKNVHKGPDKNPDPATCAAMPFGDGCRCTANNNCKSQFCFEKICASDMVQGVMGLDLFYDSFYDKVTRHLVDAHNRSVCKSVYSCRYGHTCKTKCYVVNGAANLVLDSAFLNVADTDRRLYEDVALSSRHGFVFHMLLNAGIYRSYTRTDYQGVCTLSNEDSINGKIWNSPMGVSAPPPKNASGPIPPFQNKYSCVREVMYYQVNYSALEAAGGMQYGSLAADPCARGEYYFTDIPGTNLFLLILDNYVERKSHFNFNCQIENRALNPGSFPVQKNLCVTDDHNIFKNITEGTCPARQTIVKTCMVSAANQNRPYLMILISYLALMIQYMRKPAL